jgi:hypothetical protein
MNESRISAIEFQSPFCDSWYVQGAFISIDKVIKVGIRKVKIVCDCLPRNHQLNPGRAEQIAISAVYSYDLLLGLRDEQEVKDIVLIDSHASQADSV